MGSAFLWELSEFRLWIKSALRGDRKSVKNPEKTLIELPFPSDMVFQGQKIEFSCEIKVWTTEKSIFFIFPATPQICFWGHTVNIMYYVIYNSKQFSVESFHQEITQTKDACTKSTPVSNGHKCVNFYDHTHKYEFYFMAKDKPKNTQKRDFCFCFSWFR